MITREIALGLMDGLLAEGFTVKLRAWRTNYPDRITGVDKRTWSGPVAFAVSVAASYARVNDAIRVQQIADTFGLQAWFDKDEDDEAVIKLELDSDHI